MLAARCWILAKKKEGFSEPTSIQEPVSVHSKYKDENLKIGFYPL